MPRRAERNEMGMRVIQTAPADMAVQDAVTDIDILLNMAMKQIERRPESYGAEELPKFEERTKEYFMALAEANKAVNVGRRCIPDIESWAMYLGVNRRMILKYAERSDAWREYIDNVKNCMAAIKKEASLSGAIPPIMAVFDLCNNHEYHNTSEFRLTAEAPPAVSDPEVLAADIASRRLGAEALPELPEDII